MDQIIFIYALIDPTTQQVRYVGKTNHLGKRLVSHVCNITTNIHKNHWIQKLKAQGLRPIIQVLEETSPSTWRDRERYWISYYREHTESLLNLDDGGTRGPEFVSLETRAKMSAAHKKRYQEHPEKIEESRNNLRKIDRTDPTLRAKISATHKAKYANGYKMSEEGRTKRIEATRGQKRAPLSDEHKAKISAATTGKPKGPMSEEAKAKHSISQKGKPKGPKTEEHKAKISATLAGKKRGPMSNEMKAKISAGNKGKHANSTDRPHCKLCGNFLRKDGTCASAKCNL